MKAKGLNILIFPGGLSIETGNRLDMSARAFLRTGEILPGL